MKVIHIDERDALHMLEALRAARDVATAVGVMAGDKEEHRWPNDDYSVNRIESAIRFFEEELGDTAMLVDQ
jgi:hypothetical protein